MNKRLFKEARFGGVDADAPTGVKNLTTNHTNNDKMCAKKRRVFPYGNACA